MSGVTDSLDTVPEAALLVAYGNGDPAASAELARRLVPRILSMATRMLGDAAEAEDVVQEAMLRLWRIAPDWEQGRAQVSTWLYRVAANLCTDRLRVRGRSVMIEAAGDPADASPGIERRLSDADRVRALEAALATLPERQRLAVVLRHIEELSNPEIAEIMDIGVEAVESLTARGRRALAGHLRPRAEELGYKDD